MTPEQLQKGKKLVVKIKELEDQLSRWVTAKRLFLPTIDLYTENGRGSGVDTKYIDFDVIKTLTMASIKKEIDELKQEFINL